MTDFTRTILAAGALGLACASGALADVTLSGVLTDAEDGNRFFTRLGGTAEESLTISGLKPGADYLLVTTLHDAATGAEVEVVETPLTAEAETAELVVALPVPRNEGEVNIDYVTHNVLRLAGEDAVLAEATGDAADPERAIQVHAIQRVSLVSVRDAEDGDNRIDGAGGRVEAVIRYENMVEGYDYTIWGQLLTPSGQSRSIFAAIPSFAPETKAGELTLTFEVPEGLDGISLTTSVGIFHQNRVELREDGFLVWLEDAPQPVMIASDTVLDDTDLFIEVGVPFGQSE
ncbi:hypothetical protein [Paracoccus tibetensis]|uniref:T-Q ester bond containing domain-containing protein n=1 Tax=Paracoccus tibetensis TaxID=336292 RepID=A0A1G5HG42_9RHOB|nr:hypothetical protein [Paracoccus tibetensis]SCY62743.1 hypothetical protein SAMN05660710_02171 [Paracoccus tibetensis]